MKQFENLEEEGKKVKDVQIERYVVCRYVPSTTSYSTENQILAIYETTLVE